jgi:hypothetical protein
VSAGCGCETGRCTRLPKVPTPRKAPMSDGLREHAGDCRLTHMAILRTGEPRIPDCSVPRCVICACDCGADDYNAGYRQAIEDAAKACDDGTEAGWFYAAQVRALSGGAKGDGE